MGVVYAWGTPALSLCYSHVTPVCVQVRDWWVRSILVRLTWCSPGVLLCYPCVIPMLLLCYSCVQVRGWWVRSSPARQRLCSPVLLPCYSCVTPVLLLYYPRTGPWLVGEIITGQTGVVFACVTPELLLCYPYVTPVLPRVRKVSPFPIFLNLEYLFCEIFDCKQ